MLVQIAAGSTLYPSVAGPVVLGITALAVGLRPGRWSTVAGVAVPLVLGVGVIVTAAMTGEFVDQLTNASRPGILLGTVAHVAGLAAAVAAGFAMATGRRTGSGAVHER
jgi:hypothetical protein